MNGLFSVYFRENKFSRSGKYIQPKRKFGKLSNSFNYVCLTFDDIFSSHITRFAVGSGGSDINLIKKGLIHLYSKIYYVWLKSKLLKKKNISRQKPKNWKLLRKLTFANPTKSIFLRGSKLFIICQKITKLRNFVSRKLLTLKYPTTEQQRLQTLYPKNTDTNKKINYYDCIIFQLNRKWQYH